MPALWAECPGGRRSDPMEAAGEGGQQADAHAHVERDQPRWRLPEDARLAFFKNLVVSHNFDVGEVALLIFQCFHVCIGQPADQHREPWSLYRMTQNTGDLVRIGMFEVFLIVSELGNSTHDVGR
jgi:hypothetical protein